MKTQKLILFLFMVTGLFFACNQSNTQTETTEVAADSTAVQEPEQPKAPGIVLSMVSTVKDYATWKTVFDSHKPLREAAQLSDWAIRQAKDNPNQVSLSFGVGDVEAAKQFLASDDLKQRMAEAGVDSLLSSGFFNVEFYDAEAAKISSIRVSVIHKVQDYAAWKPVFDEDATARQAAGVSIVGLGRGIDDPNTVVVVATAADFATLEGFMASEDLKQKMEKGGVIGAPQIHFDTVVWSSEM